MGLQTYGEEYRSNSAILTLPAHPQRAINTHLRVVMVQFRTSYFPGLVSASRGCQSAAAPFGLSSHEIVTTIVKAELLRTAHAAGVDGEAGGVGAPVSWLAQRPVGSLVETRLDNSRCRAVPPLCGTHYLRSVVCQLLTPVTPSGPLAPRTHCLRLLAAMTGRDCIAPEVNRNRNIGEKGANMVTTLFSCPLLSLFIGPDGACDQLRWATIHNNTNGNSIYGLATGSPHVRQLRCSYDFQRPAGAHSCR